MHRPRNFWLFLAPVLFVLVVSAVGCGGAAEEPLIRKFFQSSSMGDNMTITNIATVSFDPAKQGRATGVSVVSVSPEQVRELKFKDLEKARQEAAAAESAFEKEKKAYQDKNLDAINRILKIEATNGKVTGKDVAIQAEWNKWRAETKEHAKAVSEARAKLNAERRVADLSVPDHDPTTFDGTEIRKEATVTANVAAPDGTTSKKTFILTLERVVLKGADGKAVEGRWMITNLKESGS